jgi:hypothetical protein
MYLVHASVSTIPIIEATMMSAQAAITSILLAWRTWRTGVLDSDFKAQQEVE